MFIDEEKRRPSGISCVRALPVLQKRQCDRVEVTGRSSSGTTNDYFNDGYEGLPAIVEAARVLRNSGASGVRACSAPKSVSRLYESPNLNSSICNCDNVNGHSGVIECTTISGSDNSGTGGRRYLTVVNLNIDDLGEVRSVSNLEDPPVVLRRSTPRVGTYERSTPTNGFGRSDLEVEDYAPRKSTLSPETTELPSVHSRTDSGFVDDSAEFTCPDDVVANYDSSKPLRPIAVDSVSVRHRNRTGTNETLQFKPFATKTERLIARRSYHSNSSASPRSYQPREATRRSASFESRIKDDWRTGGDRSLNLETDGMRCGEVASVDDDESCVLLSIRSLQLENDAARQEQENKCRSLLRQQDEKCTRRDRERARLLRRRRINCRSASVPRSHVSFLSLG
ncbi:hypothetical protein QAD02_006418 [Eretmocerus hayati]|uniref:Uncharacterized protein n=1 Tax=Eretmocerus hayati TaxID=131215 RepID=A0ACC2N1N5_9HYME|nr:hypothetical protein QAD02_006418 [Eretmocerus hayati]